MKVGHGSIAMFMEMQRRRIFSDPFRASPIIILCIVAPPMTLVFSQRLELIRQSSQGDISITVTDRDGVEIVSCPKELLEDRGKRQNAQIVSTIFSLTHEQ